MYLDYLASDRVFQFDALQIKKSADYVEIVRDFLLQIQNKAQKATIGATVHRNICYLPEIWPGCKFIHIVRDPRDVTRSCVQMGWNGHVWIAADRWLDLENQWESFSGNLSKDRYITILYEELVMEPEKILSEICEFMGVAYTEDMLKYNENSTYSKPDPSLINQWKHKATQYEVSLVEWKLKHVMLKYGYKLSGYKEPNINFVIIFFLKIVARKNRLVFSINRYGFFLKVLDVLSRRLVVSRSFRRLVRNKMNEVDNRYIK